jgi:ssDNA-binding Zn-finger/Zn-ribbon topoisomerase 1
VIGEKDMLKRLILEYVECYSEELGFNRMEVICPKCGTQDSFRIDLGTIRFGDEENEVMFCIDPECDFTLKGKYRDAERMVELEDASVQGDINRIIDSLKSICEYDDDEDKLKQMRFIRTRMNDLYDRIVKGD